jgi:hypothetical protein
MTRSTAWKLALIVATLGMAAPARAGLLSDPESAGFSPRVPLSAFARPASWFDPSRLRLMSTVSVGSGFGGQTSALQVTRLSYQFGAPLTMSVSVGNTFGTYGSKNSSFFLEGLDVQWRPNANSIFRIEMRDIRSPLQYSQWGRGIHGYDPFFAPW